MCAREREYRELQRKVERVGLQNRPTPHAPTCRCATCVPATCILRDHRGFELEQPDGGGQYFAHDSKLEDGEMWTTMFQDKGIRVDGKRVLVQTSPWGPRTLPPPPPPTINSLDLARALFVSDPDVNAFVSEVTDGRKGTQEQIDRAFNRAWDRDERGWRTRAVTRSSAMLLVSKPLQKVFR